LGLKRSLGVILLLVVIIASLGSGTWLSPYCAPEQQSEHAKTNQAAEENCSSLDRIIFRTSIDVLKATGSAFDTYHDDVNAIGTIVIAVFTVILGLFTISLSKSTKYAAKTAELALLSVEIAYLYPYVRTHGINVEKIGETERPQVKSFDYGNDFITYYFKNFGRTPAEIIEVFSVIGFGMGQPPPIPVPSHPFIRLSGSVVAVGGESEDFPCDLTEFMYQNVYRGGFNPKTDMVWFSGYARYLDVFENEYVVGFCLCFSPKDGKFYSMGGKEYNYRKKTKSAGQPSTGPTTPQT
jgi:hypothetical protein